VEYLPVLEVGDKPFNRAQRWDLGIVFLIGHGKLSAFRLFLGGDQPGALVSLVAEPAAGLLYDPGGLGVGERFRVVGFPEKRVRDPDGCPVEKRYQLRVEPCGLVLAVPQFWVLRVGPAGRERAVYQDDLAPDLCRSNTRLCR